MEKQISDLLTATENHFQLVQYLLTQQKNLQSSVDSLLHDFGLVLPSEEMPLEPSIGTLRNLLGIKDGYHSYKLVLSGSFPSSICKGKYFSFEVSLISETVGFPHKKDLGVSVRLYTAEPIPKPINANMMGQQLVRGHIHTRLRFDRTKGIHTGTFKLQIKEVSSHFRNGWLFIGVFADDEFLQQTGLNVDPLLIDHVIVRAKETKSRFSSRELPLLA